MASVARITDIRGLVSLNDGEEILKEKDPISENGGILTISDFARIIFDDGREIEVQGPVQITLNENFFQTGEFDIQDVQVGDINLAQNIIENLATNLEGEGLLGNQAEGFVRTEQLDPDNINFTNNPIDFVLEDEEQIFNLFDNAISTGETPTVPENGTENPEETTETPEETTETPEETTENPEYTPESTIDVPFPDVDEQTTEEIAEQTVDEQTVAEVPENTVDAIAENTTDSVVNVEAKAEQTTDSVAESTTDEQTVDSVEESTTDEQTIDLVPESIVAEVPESTNDEQTVAEVPESTVDESTVDAVPESTVDAVAEDTTDEVVNVPAQDEQTTDSVAESTTDEQTTDSVEESTVPENVITEFKPEETTSVSVPPSILLTTTLVTTASTAGEATTVFEVKSPEGNNIFSFNFDEKGTTLIVKNNLSSEELSYDMSNELQNSPTNEIGINISEFGMSIVVNGSDVASMEFNQVIDMPTSLTVTEAPNLEQEGVSISGLDADIIPAVMNSSEDTFASFEDIVLDLELASSKESESLSSDLLSSNSELNLSDMVGDESDNIDLSNVVSSKPKEESEESSSNNSASNDKPESKEESPFDILNNNQQHQEIASSLNVAIEPDTI